VTFAGAVGPGHRVAVAAALVRHSPVLDVGAGSCLLEARVGAEYVAVDIAPQVLQPGRNRVVADLLHLPVRSGTFGTVTCISSLQYVVDVEGALEEVRRVTRRGGQLLLLVPNLAFVRNRLKLARGRIPWCSPADTWRGGTVRYFTLADLQPVLERSGWKIVGVHCSGRLRRMRRRFPSVLGADLLFDLERV